MIYGKRKNGLRALPVIRIFPYLVSFSLSSAAYFAHSFILSSASFSPLSYAAFIIFVSLFSVSGYASAVIIKSAERSHGFRVALFSR